MHHRFAFHFPHRSIFPLFILLTIASAGWCQQPVNLWQDTSVRHGSSVTLTPFLAPDGDGTSVIVCPGGSYFWLDDDGEGTQVAQWLQRNGINAFVLRYRAAGFAAFFTHYRIVARGKQYPDMLSDLEQALDYLRTHAAELLVDTSRIGAMGFSAGGHLVMSLACYSHRQLPRLAFLAPIYPVVSMAHPATHTRSRRALMGEWGRHNKTMRDSLSIEQHIPSDCPPVFLVNCVDDPVVDYRNSVLLDSALSAQNIPHRYIQYQTGAHGFGVSPSKGSPECRPWKDQFLLWLRSILGKKTCN